MNNNELNKIQKNNQTTIDCCNVIHSDVICDVKAKMPLDENLYDLAEFFKVFGDTTRIKILWALSTNEMCVCDIAALLNMSQSAISHQLRFLKNSKVVKFRKSGKVSYYSLDDSHVKQILEFGLTHINE